MSLQVNGIYEASGLALWLGTGVYGLPNHSWTLPGDIGLRTIESFADKFFSRDVVLKSAVSRGSKKIKGKERLLWPVEMICAVEKPTSLGSTKNFDSNLNLVGGHFVLWSWYYALFTALKADDPWLGRKGNGVHKAVPNKKVFNI